MNRSLHRFFTDAILAIAFKISSGCVVFEDALLGVEAAKCAQMKCVGIDRQHRPERLKKADIIVKDLKGSNFDLLKLL